MTKSNLLHAPHVPESETLGEVLNNLGVKVERPASAGLTRVKWTTRPNVQGVTAFIRLTEKGVYLTRKMAGDLLWHVLVGCGEYRGQMVILVKPDAQGYKLSKGKASPGVVRPKVINELLSAGLKPGLYEPVKIKGGWMGVPVKAEK